MDAPVYVNGIKHGVEKKLSLKRVLTRKQQLQQEMNDLEKVEKCLTQQRDDLEFLTNNIKKWAADFNKVERNNQGVPYVRNIKEMCSKMEVQLTDIHGDFYFRVQNLVTADVTCFKQIYEGLELLKKQVRKILHDDAAYKASFIEEIRQLFGKLIGISETMLDIYYEKWA